MTDRALVRGDGLVRVFLPGDGHLDRLKGSGVGEPIWCSGGEAVSWTWNHIGPGNGTREFGVTVKPLGLQEYISFVRRERLGLTGSLRDMLLAHEVDRLVQGLSW